MDSVVKSVKAINPNTKVFAYVIGESMQVPASSAWVDYESKVNSANWWLYSTGLDTSKVLSDYGKGFYVLNISTQAKKDGNGQVFAQWFGNYTASSSARRIPSSTASSRTTCSGSRGATVTGIATARSTTRTTRRCRVGTAPAIASMSIR